MPNRLYRAWLKFFFVLCNTGSAEALLAQTSELTQAQSPNLPASERQVPPIPPQDVIPSNPAPSLPKNRPQSAPSSEELLPSSPDQTTPQGEIQGTEQTITVMGFKFTGNTAFSAEELEVTTAGLTNKTLTLSRLLQVASDVSQVYVDKGYTTSGAIIVIPEATQETGQGMVEVQVVEGSLAEIEISTTEDSSRLNEGYIRSRLQRGISKPLNINDLQEALQLLQLDPLISGISATLASGSRRGESILQVKVTEAPSFYLQGRLNNYRSPSIGTFERGGSLTETNVSGLGDRISFALFNTDGSNQIDISYRIPLNSLNGTVGFNFNYQKNEVVEPPFDELNIESESTYYELSVRQPILRNINNQTQTYDEIALGLSAFWRQSSTSVFFNQPYSLPGAEADGETRIFALRFAQEWTRQNPRSVLALRSEFSAGLDAFNSTTNEQIEGVTRIPDSRFFAWRGQAQWVRSFAPDSLLLLGGNLQLANDTLLPAEQFGIGGFYTVKGYRQDALLTDNGFVAFAEYRLPLLRVASGQGILQAIPFANYGIGWNNFDLADPDPQNLASVGLGLQWRQGDNFTARFDWGIPLVDIDSRDRTLQEQGLYLSLQWSIF
ncbi:MAG: ShlB/FhaC/HecB family hemolysin secretion/activation protein [Pleurocapsa sp.]